MMIQLYLMNELSNKLRGLFMEGNAVFLFYKYYMQKVKVFNIQIHYKLSE